MRFLSRFWRLIPTAVIRLLITTVLQPFSGAALVMSFARFMGLTLIGGRRISRASSQFLAGQTQPSSDSFGQPGPAVGRAFGMLEYIA